MVLNSKKNLFEHTGKDILSILVLDYNRPNESYTLLNSIKKHIKIPHKVIFYSNGGDQSYVGDFYSAGLIDILIVSNQNEGSSIGTIRLTEICPSKYFINLQCDNFFINDITEEDFKRMTSLLETTNIRVIDFAMVGDQVFSERAFFSSLDFYSQNPYQTGYGTGPCQNDKQYNSEQAFDKWIKDNDKKILHWPKRIIADNGKYAILETKCGGILKRRCDTQELFIVKTPKEKMSAFNLNDKEWSMILSGKWPDWQIPEKSREWVFLFYSDFFENEENRKYLRK